MSPFIKIFNFSLLIVLGIQLTYFVKSITKHFMFFSAIVDSFKFLFYIVCWWHIRISVKISLFCTNAFVY